MSEQTNPRYSLPGTVIAFEVFNAFRVLFLLACVQGLRGDENLSEAGVVIAAIFMLGPPLGETVAALIPRRGARTATRFLIGVELFFCATIGAMFAYQTIRGPSPDVWNESDLMRIAGMTCCVTTWACGLVFFCLALGYDDGEFYRPRPDSSEHQ